MKKIKPILLGLVILLGVAAQAETLLPYPLDTIDGKIYYKYTVPKSIGIYRIGVNFGVSQEEILQANPHLLTKGIHHDEVILIPAKITLEEPIVTTITTDTIPSETSLLDTTLQQTDERKNERPKRNRRNKDTQNRHIESIYSNDTCDLHTAYDSEISQDSLSIDTVATDSTNDVIRLAIMLPLQTKALKREKNIDRFFDFYAGVLLAINKVQQEGQKFELYTYDIEKDATKIHAYMQDSTWQRVDAIIGPAYPQQVSAAAQYALRDSSWLLVPFSSNIPELMENPYILKFNPSAQASTKAFVEYLKDIKDYVNCVLIETRETETIPTSIALIHQELKKHDLPTTTTTLRHIYTDSIDGAMVEGKENIIIFNTENYNNIQTLIPHLQQASQNYDITLYSQFSWVDKNIALPIIYTSAFSDTLAIPDIYELDYLKYFGHELSSTHPRYDLLGYDLTLYLVQMIQQTKEETGLIPTEEWVGTQTMIHLQKTSTTGGYENQIIHIIRK